MSPLAQSIANDLRSEAQMFTSLVDKHRDASWPDFLRAWGELRRSAQLSRDEDGRYLLVTNDRPSRLE